jgi:hypothetical protein
MGRFIYLILWPVRALYGLLALAVIFICGVCVAFFGCEIKRRDERDGQRLTEDASYVAPDLDNDDELRRWLNDLSPADRLEVVNIWYQRQAAQCGRVGETVEVWGERRRVQREAALAQRN